MQEMSLLFTSSFKKGKHSFEKLEAHSLKGPARSSVSWQKYSCQPSALSTYRMPSDFKPRPYTSRAPPANSEHGRSTKPWPCVPSAGLLCALCSSAPSWWRRLCEIYIHSEVLSVQSHFLPHFLSHHRNQVGTPLDRIFLPNQTLLFLSFTGIMLPLPTKLHELPNSIFTTIWWIQLMQRT